MAFSKRIYENVNQQFFNKRISALKTHDERKDRLFREVPRLSEIDSKLSKTMLSVCRAYVSGETLNLKTLESESKALINERSEILKSMGLSENYLSLNYECEKCHDYGYIGTVPCECYADALKKEAFAKSVIAQSMPEACFDNFDLGFYSEAFDETGISPKERMETNLLMCKDFAFDFEKQSRSLLFLGGTGLGKTFLSGCIAKELIKKGHYVVYDTAYNVFSSFEKERFSSGGAELTAHYFDCELLILDDLGTELITSFTVAALYNLVNSRLLQKKLMIISSNFDFAELEKFYTPRILSRMEGEFLSLRFAGADIRRQKPVYF